MLTRLPLYVAALLLLTAALYAVEAVPRYVAVLALAGGLLTFAVGSWRAMRKEQP